MMLYADTPFSLSLWQQSCSSVALRMTHLTTYSRDCCTAVAERCCLQGNVRCMVDAEQSYMQPVMDALTIQLQQRFNRSVPVIFNTYQCYLKSTEHRYSRLADVMAFPTQVVEREQLRHHRVCQLILSPAKMKQLQLLRCCTPSSHAQHLPQYADLDPCDRRYQPLLMHSSMSMSASAITGPPDLLCSTQIAPATVLSDKLPSLICSAIAASLSSSLAQPTCLRLLLCRLQRDLARAASEGWKLGLKTVRGAYMHVERSLALDKGVPSPIHDSLADTRGCYDRSVLPGTRVPQSGRDQCPPPPPPQLAV